MNPHEFTAIRSKLQLRQDLTDDEMRQVVGKMLSGDAEPSSMKELLELLADKGESVQELVGASLALRDTMRRVSSEHPKVVDTCGTGGDGSKTFNISTAAALVTASAGVPVAKHGNRKVTSSTGSADVLSELGINLEASPELVTECLNELGICFLFAPFFHPAMRNVGDVRREIARPTIFNRLGPLANPAAAGYQVLGVGDPGLQDRMAEALQQLGTQRSVVVRGMDGVDELSLSAPTRVLEVTPENIQEHTWTPEDFGLSISDRAELHADDPASSADCIRQVLAGDAGPKRDVVVMNAAAGLWIVGRDPSLEECAKQVAEAIDSGKAARKVDDLAAMTSRAGG